MKKILLIGACCVMACDAAMAGVKYTETEFIDCACQVTKKNIGKRKEIKELSYKLVDMYDNADINILNSMFHVNPNTTYQDK